MVDFTENLESLVLFDSLVPCSLDDFVLVECTEIML